MDKEGAKLCIGFLYLYPQFTSDQIAFGPRDTFFFNLSKR